MRERARGVCDEERERGRRYGEENGKKGHCVPLQYRTARVVDYALLVEEERGSVGVK